MAEPVYRRVLLKLSGEALAGGRGTGLDFALMGRICGVLKECRDLGVQMGVVIGGGNFWRGAKADQMERSRADQMGMLATIMNCLAFGECCERSGLTARVMSALEMPAVAEFYDRRKAVEYLEAGDVVIFGGGTGCPYFSTDTGAALRAVQIGADVILLAKNIDGVYTADPAKVPDAKRYDKVSYEEVLAKKLGVMDLTATSLAMDNHVPALVFALKDPRNILRAVTGEAVGTLVGERAL